MVVMVSFIVDTDGSRDGQLICRWLVNHGRLTLFGDHSERHDQHNSRGKSSHRLLPKLCSSQELEEFVGMSVGWCGYGPVARLCLTIWGAMMSRPNPMELGVSLCVYVEVSNTDMGGSGV